MNRRSALIALAFGPLTRGAFAQTSTTQRVSWLSVARPTAFPASFDAFRQGLAGHGYVEGRNLALDAHWAEDSEERLAALTQEKPTQYKLVVNVRTAQSLGFDVPQSLLQRADEVIR